MDQDFKHFMWGVVVIVIAIIAGISSYHTIVHNNFIKNGYEQKMVEGYNRPVWVKSTVETSK